MSWYAKPSGGYSITSTEGTANVWEIYNQLKDSWTVEAISGMIGNLSAESGLNPWRWQSDTVDLTSNTKGYGLPQFTPAYGYINDYGKGVEGYAPNLSTSTTTSGANASDGKAQIIVIDTDKAGKYINRKSYCTFLDISSAYPFSNYKQLTDLYTATVAWLYNYEFPKDHSKAVADARYTRASTVYQILKGQEPPTPPTPTPTTRKGMPLYMMMRRF